MNENLRYTPFVYNVMGFMFFIGALINAPLIIFEYITFIVYVMWSIVCFTIAKSRKDAIDNATPRIIQAKFEAILQLVAIFISLIICSIRLGLLTHNFTDILSVILCCMFTITFIIDTYKAFRLDSASASASASVSALTSTLTHENTVLNTTAAITAVRTNAPENEHTTVLLAQEDRIAMSRGLHTTASICEYVAKKVIKQAIADNDTNCSICVDEITNSNVGVMPCGHIFHASCLNSFDTHSRICPNCREVGIPWLKN